jgi:tetratricopeptide (TPR) repeat protein
VAGAQPLLLEALDYRGPSRWRWRLQDAAGNLLADHAVHLDPGHWQYEAFRDLSGYLNDHAAPDRRRADEERLLAEAGAWIGEHVLGPVGPAILAAGTPATVRVLVPAKPKAAAALLYGPLELAHVGGRPLGLQDVSLVFEVQGVQTQMQPRPVGGRLRVLAVFSQPRGTLSLNLRRERYELQRSLRSLARRKGLALELRVLQYGVTRQELQDILEEGEGWDVVHFSGHGAAAKLILEKPDGSQDVVAADELAELLRPSRSRLKWVTLSACLSAAATLEETRRWLGLEPRRSRASGGTRARRSGRTASVAGALAAELDCAVLAMRYPVADSFAIALGQHLYEGVLEKGQSLDRALQLALPATVAEFDSPPLSAATPTLFGRRAASLTLPVPEGDPRRVLPNLGLAGFLPPPEHFVGRAGMLARASQALAPESGRTGVLFFGMAGSGKSACALELAWHYEDLRRFTGFVWYKAPDEGHEIGGSLAAFAQAFETQLGVVEGENLEPPFPLVAMVGAETSRFDAYLPRLRKFLEERSLLLVLDNLESLLRPDGAWRDERWEKLIAALLGHRGESRTLLTARIKPRLPRTADPRGKLLELSVHALSLDESAMLARELPNLGRLLRGQAAKNEPGRQRHRELVTRTLELVQGHPKLLELAEGQAARPQDLRRYLERAGKVSAAQAGRLEAFFRTGASKLQAEEFLAVLGAWTNAVAATLSPAARTLFHFLCCLEEEDRWTPVVEANWGDLWRRLAPGGDLPDLTTGLAALEAAGLVDLRDQAGSEEQTIPRACYVHPGVAGAGRAAAGDNFQAAVDDEMAAFWLAVFEEGGEDEVQGGGALVVQAGRAAAPYLLRQGHWREASTLLEQALLRDASPAALALVLPLLRRLAQVTNSNDLGPGCAGLLAKALRLAGRLEEAEPLLRKLVDLAVARQDFRVAHGAIGELVFLLRDTGRVEHALSLTEQMASYSRAAGMGLWTQLADESQRMGLLNGLGRYEEVLEAAEQLADQMRGMPNLPGPEEVAISRRLVYEWILDAGRAAALGLGQWDRALALNSELANIMQACGATRLALARMRFNDNGALLRLGRLEEARRLLLDCKDVFQLEGGPNDLGLAFTGLASVERSLGHPGPAIDYGRLALRYKYLASTPGECAIGHSNLANSLLDGADPVKDALAHRLAAAVIRLQTADGRLPYTLRDLAAHLAMFAPGAAPLPADFDELCQRVERVDGVRFRELFGRLPPARAATGDDALRIVLQMAKVPPDG